MALTQCSDGSWCCQGGNTTCCTKNEGLLIVATIGMSTTTSATLTPSSTTASGTIASTGTPAPVVTSIPSTPSTTPVPEKKTSSKVGIVVGVTIGVVVLTVLAIFSMILLKRKSRRQSQESRGIILTGGDEDPSTGNDLSSTNGSLSTGG